MSKAPSKLVMQVVLSDGTEVTLRVSQPLTASSIEELQMHLMAYLTVCEWVLRRKEAREKGMQLFSSLFSWWQRALEQGERV